MGFDGKTLIHPGQVEGANAAFAPSEQAVEDARGILQAWEDGAGLRRGHLRRPDDREPPRRHPPAARWPSHEAIAGPTGARRGLVARRASAHLLVEPALGAAEPAGHVVHQLAERVLAGSGTPRCSCGRGLLGRLADMLAPCVVVAARVGRRSRIAVYSPESTQRRSSAARTTANGWAGSSIRQQLEHRVAQVGGVEVLLALREERRLVELVDGRRTAGELHVHPERDGRVLGGQQPGAVGGQLGLALPLVAARR